MHHCLWGMDALVLNSLKVVSLGNVFVQEKRIVCIIDLAIVAAVLRWSNKADSAKFADRCEAGKMDTVLGILMCCYVNFQMMCQGKRLHLSCEQESLQ